MLSAVFDFVKQLRAGLVAGHLGDLFEVGDASLAELVGFLDLLFQIVLTGLHLVLAVLEFFQLAVEFLFFLFQKAFGALQFHAALLRVAFGFETDFGSFVARLRDQQLAVALSAGPRFLDDVLRLRARFRHLARGYALGDEHPRSRAPDDAEEHSKYQIHTQKFSLLMNLSI